MSDRNEETTSLADMEARDSRDQLSQQLCSNCDTSQSKFWCLDCNGSLCGDCELAHRRVSLTRSHRLHNQPQSVARIPVAPVKYCRMHMSEPLELYCFTCEQFTCKDCQLTTHRSHSFEFVSKAVVAVRRRLQASVRPVSAQKDTLTTTVQDMESRLEYIQVTKAQLKSNLLTCYFTVVHGLKDKITRIFQDIVEVFLSESERIESRLKELKLLQQKYVTMIETSEKCKTVTDLQNLLNMKRQIESDMKDVLDQDLSPPPNMCRVTVRSCTKSTEFIENFFKVDVSWIPFSGWQSSSQRPDPPPACPDGTPLASTSPSYPSLHNLKPRGYTPPSSSSNPSSSSFASPRTSSYTVPAPCKNPPQSTPTSKAPSSLPRTSPYTVPAPCKNPPQSTPTSKAPSSLPRTSSYTVPAPCKNPPQSTPTSSLPHAGSSFVPISESSPLMNILRYGTEPAVTHSSSSSASSFPPFTCSLGSSATAAPAPTPAPAPAPPVTAPAEQLRSIVQPSPFTFNVVPRSALLSKHQTPLPPPTLPPEAPPRQAAPSQNQQPGVQHATLPGTGAPVFCLTNVYTPPTVLIPAHTQSAWIPAHPTRLLTKPPPTYPGHSPIVAFSMAPQFNPVDGAFLSPLGQVLPAPGNLVPLSGSTFLQHTPINQVPVVPSAGPSSHQQLVSKNRSHGLRKPVSHRVSKPAENKPSTTVSERTEPAEEEPTSTLPEKSDSMENEPTSTTADQTDAPADQPSTTTSTEEDAKLITSTSGDLEFAETPETPSAREEQPRPAIGRQRSDPAKRQLRLSLFRLPIAPPTPGGSLPSFRLVHGEVENEIYLMEMTGSPAKAMSEVDFTEPLNDSGSEFDFTEPLDDSGSEMDFTEPLSSPGSDLSMEILSCSVCISAESLLICSGCARGFHRECHIPPMGPDITPRWICSLCQDLSDPSDPYDSVRLPDPLGRGLKLPDQRRCESLLLFLKVEGCSRLTEFGSWSLLEPIAERLRLRLEPPYKTTVDFVSDVWTVFRHASQILISSKEHPITEDDALKDLQKSFRKKVKKVLGRGKPLLQILRSGAEEDRSESRPGPGQDRSESGLGLGHFRKRLKSLLDIKTPKKMKKTS